MPVARGGGVCFATPSESCLQRRRRSVVPILAALIFGAALFAGGCQQQRRGSSFGADYFLEDFRCSTKPLVQETHPHYDLLYREFRRRFADDTAARKKAEVVLVGDSTAMFFSPELLQTHLPGVDIVNRGIGGETTQLLLGRLDDVSALAPRVILVVIGGNDLLGGRCIPEILENTRRIVSGLQSSGSRPRVILVSVPPVLTWKANSISPYFNWHLRRLAESLGAGYMDLWTELARPDLPELKAEYVRFVPGKKKPDSVHFNEAGYGAWARLIRSALSSK